MKIPSLILPLFAVTTPLVTAFPDKAKAPAQAVAKDASALTDDFINFKNNDTLHGKFLGFTSSGKIIWKNAAAEKNIAFTADEVRKVVINKGRMVKPFSHTSYLTLNNQDTIPGEVLAVTDKFVTLKTDYSGEIKIPRNTISSVDFLPLGDKIQFRGPFTEDGWSHSPYHYSTSSRAKVDDKDAWNLKNFAFVNNGVSGVVMLNKDLAEKSRYTFNVTSRNSIMPSFVISADLKKPENKKEKDDKAKRAPAFNNRSAGIATVTGTSLIFRLHSYSSSLSFYSFDKEGNPTVENLTNTISSAASRQRKETYSFDVRIDKEAGNILLYSDNALIGQWDISAYTEKLKGNKMGFATLYSSASNACVVSDIVVSSWNGIIDPASSMENEERDTILLTNGTDRYSGKAIKLEENKLQLKGAYAELLIPTDQIQSLYFAKKNRVELRSKNEDEVSVRFHGSGRITGTLMKGPEGKIILDSEFLGKLTIDLDYVSSYEFEDMDHAYEILK